MLRGEGAGGRGQSWSPSHPGRFSPSSSERHSPRLCPPARCRVGACPRLTHPTGMDWAWLLSLSHCPQVC